MTQNITITINECDRSELNLILGFRGLGRGKWSVRNGRYTVEAAISFASDLPQFAKSFASHLNPVIRGGCL